MMTPMATNVHTPMAANVHTPMAATVHTPPDIHDDADGHQRTTATVHTPMAANVHRLMTGSNISPIWRLATGVFGELGGASNANSAGLNDNPDNSGDVCTI
jgi:hypothetical protein